MTVLRSIFFALTAATLLLLLTYAGWTLGGSGGGPPRSLGWWIETVDIIGWAIIFTFGALTWALIVIAVLEGRPT